MIHCTNCNKEIEQKWTRTLCIHCRNLMDKIRIAQRNQSEEYKRYQQEYKKRKKFWSLENEMISLDEQRYCEILMLLSISEDPIRLLIYILS